MFIYGTFPSVLHYMTDFQAAFFFPQRKVKLLLSWLLKDSVYLKSSLGFTTNLIDFEDCFPSYLWSFLCFFFRFTNINNINNKYFYIWLISLYVYMHVQMHACTHYSICVEVRGQLYGIGSLLILCGFQVSNSCHQTWWDSPLPVESSHWPKSSIF